MNNIQVGDLIITNHYHGKEVEYCTYQGKKGSVVQKIFPGGLESERYINNGTSLPYSSKHYVQPTVEYFADLLRECHTHNEALK